MTTSFYNVETLLGTKKLDEFPEEISYDAIDLISLPETKVGLEFAQPYGSFTNRIADYYGDVDLHQLYVFNGDIEHMRITLAKEFQKIVKNILKSKNHFYSEIKAGLDKRFKFDIGLLENNIYTLSEEMYIIPQELHEQGLLSDIEMKVILNVIKKHNRDGNDYDIINGLFRNHYVLRWTADDILRGHINVPKHKYYLTEVILDMTPLKIDMIMITSDDKVLEVTNFINLGLESKKDIEGQTLRTYNLDTDETYGYYFPINFDIKEHGESIESLTFAVEELYYSNAEYSPFKLTKRCFAMLKQLYHAPEELQKIKYRSINFGKTQIENLVQKYASILKSSIGILYSIRSELDTIVLLLERNKNVPIDKINFRVSSLLNTLSNVLEIDDEKLEEYTNLFYDFIGSDVKVRKRDKVSIKKKIEILDFLVGDFKKVINYWTVTYWNKLQLNPPPLTLLPNDIKYNSNIIRKPNDNPENPLKVALEQADKK